MPLNKLQNFIKNTEGRILYVNPNDLDATDSVSNTGNSLTQPFKTIQRALIESARFSFLAGAGNDLVEKTTILLFPGEHLVDNRPGWGIRKDGSVARVFPPSGSSGSDPLASSILSLELDSNFDLTQEDNILYKFNSINGGVIVPRGTSIVGLDLRKTKIRPKYVPNPTDLSINKSTIFRVTGACYFWQFSIFDGDESGLVYTHPYNFTSNYQSNPTFSHHKLSCFEYADGLNQVGSYGLTDLDMYYSKVSNAYNSYREIPSNSKYPTSLVDFAKQDPEWKIVGAFASDPIGITSIFANNSGSGKNPITVITSEDHNFNAGTPIKIRGVSESAYNISTKVSTVDSSDPKKFTYSIPSAEPTLPINPDASGSTVTIETDTVSGASPYIFNCSLRSVWGMNGLLADGSKASGFRSMVVAQFTAVSLQKDDRAFVKYDSENRVYNGVSYSTVIGAALATQASQTNNSLVYHLDPKAVYRQGWESSHIKITNDAFVQIVSVFAIGFNKHFDLESGADASITNSNSNFGQISLNSDGFRAAAFDKDDHGFITSIIPPRDIDLTEENIEWLSIDIQTTINAGISTHLYLYGLTAKDSLPVSVTQGYRIGARVDDKLYLDVNGSEYSANIYMQDGVTSSYKVYNVTNVSSSVFTLDRIHGLADGEKIIINSETGDLPEYVIPHTVYYAIVTGVPGPSANTKIKLATSYTNALNGQSISLYGGTQLKVYSRVSDKGPGDIGSPIQYDSTNKNWFITVNSNNQIYNQLPSLVSAGTTETTDLTYVKRIVDDRSLDEKLYKVRVVIPKEYIGAKDPQTGFVIQESSTTGAASNSYFSLSSITANDFDYNRNSRFITTCTLSSNTVTVLTSLPHNLNVDDVVTIREVTDSNNTSGRYNIGYNGRFKVASIVNDMSFTYSTRDVDGVDHNPGTSSTNNINSRTTELPRFERNDLQSNLYVYRNEVISPYIEGSQDGIYHLYLLNASNKITTEFTNLEFSQSSVNLYPQLDRDNIDPNPPAAKTFALRSPIGDTNTSDLKKSITRETIDKALTTLGIGLTISSVSGSTISFGRNHGLGGITGGTITAGASYSNGTYYDVKLLGGTSDPNSISATWSGANAKVVVGSGNVTSVEITSGGSDYNVGDSLYFDKTRIGVGNDLARYTVTGISSNFGDVIQVTGIGTTSDGYYRITSLPNTNQIGIARTAGDPTIIPGQYAFILGPSAGITSAYNPTVGITSFTTSIPHGLLAGNKFRVIDGSTNNLGDFVVKASTGTLTFTATTNKNISLTSGWILKHGLSANEGISDAREENFGTRQVSIYGGEYLTLSSSLSSSGSSPGTLTFVASGIGTNTRFPMGSYIQVDNELMRITSSNNTTQFTVLRGVLGTRKESHTSGSLIRKIHPIAIEFRRPSILRASGHTFEYLGYGPGNYSTSLPQVQVRSLTEREDFLSQSQERSCGTVVYTGMNNNGDYFTGNTKTSSVSGEITSYDIPTPTVTGQDPSKSSVVYDEVTIKERLLVEGGDSGTVLSQFDGPVTFNQQTRFKNDVTFSDDVRITSTTTSDSSTKGALTVKGGVGIAENLNVGGKITVTGTSSFNSNFSVTGVSTFTGNVSVTGASTFTGLLDANGGATIDDIQIGITANNEIDTFTGNLILDSSGGTTTIDDNLSVTGVSTFTGLLDANGGATVDNIRIGVADDNEIDTFTGNLTIDSSGGTTTIDDNLSVTGVSTFTGLLDANGGATVDNIRIGVANDNTIDTSSSNLTINASIGSTVAISTNTSVSGNATVTGSVTADTFSGNGITPIGGIIMWSGTVAAAIALEPSWAICDGRTVNGKTTPDLRNRFVVGAYSDGSDTTYPDLPPNAAAGTADAVVVSHNHGITDTGHTHTASSSTTGSHDHHLAVNEANTSDLNGSNDKLANRRIEGGAGEEYKLAAGNGTIEVGKTSTEGSHSHTITVDNGTTGISINTQGESGTNKNLPPYYALAFIMRTT